MAKVKEYAILNENIDEAMGGNVVYTSKDKNDIVDYLTKTGRNADDDGTTVEIYYVDAEDDEFLEGSDYDTPSNFIKNIEMR